MNLYVYIKHKKYAGVFTNDKLLMRYLRRHPAFQIWYIVLEGNKMVGIAFLSKTKSLIKEVKEIVSQWKKRAKSAHCTERNQS